MEMIDYGFSRSGKSKQASLQAFFQTTLSLCVHTSILGIGVWGMGCFAWGWDFFIFVVLECAS
jgi:hypothetical protein